MQIGGHIAALSHTTDNVSPFWQPPWPSMDFYKTEPAVIQEVYGDIAEGQLLSCIVGHNLVSVRESV